MWGGGDHANTMYKAIATAMTVSSMNDAKALGLDAAVKKIARQVSGVLRNPVLLSEADQIKVSPSRKLAVCSVG